MSEELKPCPFCGSEEVALTPYYPPSVQPEVVFIECQQCRARTDFYDPKRGRQTDREKLIELWNKRKENNSNGN